MHSIGRFARLADQPAEHGAKDPAVQLVDTIVVRMTSERSPVGRRVRAEHLLYVLSYLSGENKLQSSISDLTRDRLVELLNDDIDTEDPQVALALAGIGSRASRAVPFLKAAFKRACAELPIVRTGQWPVDDFEFALKVLTGEAPRC